jgi:hypothetical protein
VVEGGTAREKEITCIHLQVRELDSRLLEFQQERIQAAIVASGEAGADF